MLGDSLHLYGIDDLFVDDTSIDDDSVQKMAHRYARCIVEHASGAPFAVVGFSFGGVVAWEVAAFLSAQPDRPRLLGVVLIDARCDAEITDISDASLVSHLVMQFQRSTGRKVEVMDTDELSSKTRDEICRHVAQSMEAVGMYPPKHHRSDQKRQSSLD